MNNLMVIAGNMQLTFLKILFVVACVFGSQYIMAQSEADIEIAVSNVDQMIKDHDVEFKDVLKLREAAGYQLNPTAVVKAVFLRRLRTELVERMHITNALNATEVYCLDEKSFPAQIVTNVKNEITQELQ